MHTIGKIGKYSVIKEIYRSQNHLLHLVSDPLTGSPIVLKSINPVSLTKNAVNRLKNCLSALTTLKDSPHVIKPIGIFENEGTQYLQLEYIEGETLRQRLDRGPVALEEFFALTRHILEGMADIHRAQIIHKDINPGNIMLLKDGQGVKFIDFEISTRLSIQQTEYSPANRIEGSLFYLSPEQTGRMNRMVDFRTDFYSLGATLFEMLAGETLFQAEDAIAWIHHHIAVVPDRTLLERKKIPATVIDIILKLLAKDADDRYQNLGSLIADIKQCQALHSQNGVIPSFEIGRLDRSEKFSFPQKLYGREEQLNLLFRTFAEVHQTNCPHLFLVSGYSGIGKTTIIHEVHRTLAKQNGRFIAGKFDQFKRDVPFDALVQAINQLITHMMAETPAVLDAWKGDVLRSVGRNGAVLVEAFPDLALLLGAQEEVVKLAPTESKNRFMDCFKNFVRAIATTKNPLVLFIDDLQWADSASLELLWQLLEDQSYSLLVIGAYRDNEVSSTHPLVIGLERSKLLSPNQIHQIELTPLNLDTSVEYLRDMFLLEPTEGTELAKVLLSKTKGNPFFFKQLIATLHVESYIHYDANSASWRLDMEAIKRFEVSDNVVEILVKRLEALDRQCLEMLKVGSCLASSFSVETMERILRRMGKALDCDTYETLALGETEGFLFLRDDKARFVHDRVQHSIHTFISESEKSAIHYAIACDLYERQGRIPSDDTIVELAGHFNLAGDCRNQDISVEEIATINFNAGIKAKKSASFHRAAHFFEQALLLLPSTQNPNGFECRFELAQCKYMLGLYQDAQDLFNSCLAETSDKTMKAKISITKLVLMQDLGQHVEAVVQFKESARMLGLPIASDVEGMQKDIGFEREQSIELVGTRKIADLLKLPDMTDAHALLEMRLLVSIIPAAYFTDLLLYSWLGFRMLTVTLRHGSSKDSSFAYSISAVVTGSFFGDPVKGYEYGLLGLRNSDRFADPNCQGKSYMLMSLLVSHWTQPLESSTDMSRKAIGYSLETGDYLYSGWSMVSLVRILSQSGKDLDSVISEIGRHKDFLKQKMPELLGFHNSIESFSNYAIHGKDETNLIVGDSYLAVLKAQQLTIPVTTYCLYKMMFALMEGDSGMGKRFAHECEGTLPFSAGQHELIDYSFYKAAHYFLDWLRTPDIQTRDGTKAVLIEAKAFYDSNERNCAANFAHKSLALSAMLAFMEDSLFVAIEKFEDAIKSAKKYSFIHFAAIISEFSGNIFLPRNAVIATAFFKDAYFLYEQWGAKYKSKYIMDTHRSLFEREVSILSVSNQEKPGAITNTTVFNTVDFDYRSLVKSSQAIISEINIGNLTTSLIRIMLENSGADKCVLLLKTKFEWEEKLGVVAFGDAHGRVESIEPDFDYEDRVSSRIIRYVGTAKRSIVLDHAFTHPTYEHCPYIAKYGVKSIMCLPILSQGDLKGIVYLENRKASATFTSDRLATINYFASQAAIAIENALLYREMEDRVTERTRQLQERNSDIRTILENMAQGVFTIDERGQIDREYSPYLEEIFETKDLVGQDGVLSLLRNSGLTLDEIDAIRMAAVGSIGCPALGYSMNSHMFPHEIEVKNQLATKVLEIDWQPIIYEDQVGKIMIIVRDVTAMRTLLQEASDHRQELTIIDHILACGSDGFNRFASEAADTIAWMAEKLSSPGIHKDELFRRAHTLKGNARMLQFVYLSDAARDFENALDEISPGSQVDVGVLKGLLEEIIIAKDRYETVYQNRLKGFISHQSHEGLEQCRLLLSNIETKSIDEKINILSQLHELFAGKNDKTFDLVKRLAPAIGKIAEEIGKPAPRLVFTGENIVLPSSVEKLLANAFGHCLRNAVDHGIETADVREAKGKRGSGLITFQFSLTDQDIVIELTDDGAGLNIPKLRQLGLAGGVIGSTATDSEIAEVIFASGLSTAKNISDISGRGVGMDAVRSMIEERGGSVSIEFMGPRDANGFQPFRLRLVLPIDHPGLLPMAG